MATWKWCALVIPIFMTIDLLWLGVVMKSFYSREMGDLMRRNGDALAPRWGAAILVYLLLPLGLAIFVRPQLTPSSPLWLALAWGAAYGLVTYGTYDLTNFATLEKWTLKLTVADMLWGCTLCGTVSAIMHLIARGES